MLAKKIAYNTIISLASRILSTVGALLVIGITTRYLGQNGFGNYSTVLAFLYVFSVLADLGLYSITVREISKEGTDERTIVSHAFSLRFWSGLLIFGVAPFVAWFFPYPPMVKIGIALAAAGQWFLSNAQVLMGVFQKYLKMEKAALAELGGRIVQFALVAVIVWQRFGFFSIILAFSLSCLANFLLVLFFARKYVSFKIGWNPPHWKKLLTESFPLAISAVFVMIYFKLDTVMLSVMKPATDVGIYSIAYKILESLIFFPAMFVGLVMPLLSRHALANPEEFKKVSQKSFEILLIFAVPLAVGGLLLSKSIIALVAGPGFEAASGVLKILIFATAVIFFGSLFSNMIIAIGRQRALAKIYGLGALVNLGVNLILIPRFSYWGAASSTLFTEALVTILMLAVISRSINFLPSFWLATKILLAVSLMVLALYFLSSLNFFILLLLAGSVYFGALLVVGGVSFDDVGLLIKSRE